MTLKRKNIYKIRKDTCLAEDMVVPFTKRIQAFSDLKQKAMALKLLENKKKG